MKQSEDDRRPAPKLRKHIILWQVYLQWNELMEWRKKHTLRMSSAEKGKSSMSAKKEQEFLDMLGLDKQIETARRAMIFEGQRLGPIWDWLTSIKGLGAGGLAAQLLAQIDDIAQFDTISKLWRFCGMATYEYWVDERGSMQAPLLGKIARNRDGNFIKPMPGDILEHTANERNVQFRPTPKPDWHLEQRIDAALGGFLCPYNKLLKSVCWQIVNEFIKCRTPLYADIYNAEKERLKTLHPEIIKNSHGPFKKSYTPAHIHAMSMRKTSKIFLQHCWLTWRESEGLSVSEPYVQAILGHTHIIPAPIYEE